jgi:hypothetical protein
MRPAEFCRGVLASMDAAEQRRRRRPRDTTPDAIGLALQRELLERAIASDPPPAEFEWWLAGCVRECGDASGPMHATALRLFGEWRLAQSNAAFRDWLAHGAPSDDATA